MNSKRENKQTGASAHFPSLPADWVDDVMLELRLRDVKGARIMEILTEAEQHCVESGRPPEEAFGDPTEYAANFDFEGQDRAPGAGVGAYVAAGAAMLFGCLLVTRHVWDLAAGRTSQLTVGDVLSALLVCVIFVTITRWLRAFLNRPLLVGGLGMAGWMAVFVGLRVWGGPEIANAAASVFVAVGFALAIGGAVTLSVLTLRDPQDGLVRPGEMPRRDRAADRSQLLAIWALPLFMLAMSAYVWFTR